MQLYVFDTLSLVFQQQLKESQARERQLMADQEIIKEAARKAVTEARAATPRTLQLSENGDCMLLPSFEPCCSLRLRHFRHGSASRVAGLQALLHAMRFSLSSDCACSANLTKALACLGSRLGRGCSALPHRAYICLQHPSTYSCAEQPMNNMRRLQTLTNADPLHLCACAGMMQHPAYGQQRRLTTHSREGSLIDGEDSHMSHRSALHSHRPSSVAGSDAGVRACCCNRLHCALSCHCGLAASFLSSRLLRRLLS